MRRVLPILAFTTLLATAAVAHSPMNRFWGEVPVDMQISGDVLIVKPLIVPRDVTLTVEPGTVVRFEGAGESGNRLVVHGRLVAEGTKDRPIRFMPKDKGSGKWQGIVFERGGKGSLTSCVIEGSVKGVVDPYGGASLNRVEVRR